MAKKQGQNEAKEDGGLEPKYQTAVYWRILGLPYLVIASRLTSTYQIQVSPKTLRNWFSKGGICYAAYQEEKANRTKEGSEVMGQIDEKIGEMVPAALGVISQSIESGNLGAAFRVLELKGYTPVKKIEDVTDKSEALEILKEIVAENEKTARKHIQTKRKPNPAN